MSRTIPSEVFIASFETPCFYLVGTPDVLEFTFVLNAYKNEEKANLGIWNRHILLNYIQNLEND